MLAAFLVMLWIVPFDSASLPVHLPFESKLDRVVIIGISFVWLASLLVGGRTAPKLRSSPLNWAVGGFLLAAIVSILVNVDQLVNLDELSLSVKKLALLLGYVLFYFLVTSIIRPAEVPAFVTFVIGLACITAIGTIIEYRTGLNVFFEWGAKILAPIGLTIDPQPPDDPFGARLDHRADAARPRRRADADVRVLAVPDAPRRADAAPPLARRRRRGRDPRRRVRHAAQERARRAGRGRRGDGRDAPARGGPARADRRRDAARDADRGARRAGLDPQPALHERRSRRATRRPAAREDYAAVQPDLAAHPTFGRGYGSYDPHKYRIIDNQYIGLAIETGFVGVGAYLLMLLGVVAAVAAGAAVGRPAPRAARPRRRVRRRRHRRRRGAVRRFAYPQVPYVFLFVAGLAVVLGRGDPWGNGSEA